MQLQGPTADQVPPLPTAPMWEVWTLEQPLVPALVLAGVGIVLGLTLHQRGKRAVGGLLLALGLLAGVGVYIAGTLIETPRERIRGLSADLARATAEADIPAVRGILDPAVRISQPGFRFPSIERRGIEEVVREIEQLEGTGAVASIEVLETRASSENPRTGRSHIRVRALNSEGGWLGHSWWEIDWVKRDDRWLAVEITPLWVQFG